MNTETTCPPERVKVTAQIHFPGAAAKAEERMFAASTTELNGEQRG